LKESGDIASLCLADEGTLAGNFYVDCTGFSSLLIGKALGTPFASFKNNLFNDAAVAIQAPHDGYSRRANAANTSLSDPLRQLLRTWLASKPISAGIAQGRFGRGYPIMSWYSLLAGVGLFPGETRAPTRQEAKYDMAEIDALLERSAMNFPDHREFLRAIPPKPRQTSLQVYFW
jgi:hypothetical protein